MQHTIILLIFVIPLFPGCKKNGSGEGDFLSPAMKKDFAPLRKILDSTTILPAEKKNMRKFKPTAIQMLQYFTASGSFQVE
ncbi:hypothetical protein KJ865_11240, partial [Myxococcota bacterium]|nr:hypothetical protein [Myxococcota bacterium]